MKKFSFKKIGNDDRVLKILSVICAVVLWLIVAVSLSDSISHTVKDVPVSTNLDKSIVSQMGLEVIGYEEQTVDIYVEGSRYQVGALTADDFDITCIYNDVTSAGTYTIPVSVQKKKGSNSSEYEILGYSPQSIQMKFDRIISQNFALNTEVTGVEIPEGHITRSFIPSVDTITVTGSENDVRRISQVVVEADLEEDEPREETFSVEAQVKLLDAAGTEIDPTLFELSAETVTVTVPVFKCKTIPLTFEFINIPSGVNTYRIDYTMSEQNIEIAGPAETIDGIKQLNLGYIDFKKIGIESKFVFDVQLPSNILNLGNVAKVSVDFPLEGYAAQTFTVSEIKVTDAPAYYKIDVLSAEVPGVKVIAPQTVLELMEASELVAEVDLSKTDIAVGQMNVPVRIVAPNRRNVWAYGDYSVVVNITLETEEEAGGE